MPTAVFVGTDMNILILNKILSLSLSLSLTVPITMPSSRVRLQKRESKGDRQSHTHIFASSWLATARRNMRCPMYKNEHAMTNITT